VLRPYFKDALAAHAPGKSLDPATLQYVIAFCSTLVSSKVYDLAQWRPALVPYLTPAVGEAAAEAVAAAFLARAVKVRCAAPGPGLPPPPAGAHSPAAPCRSAGLQHLPPPPPPNTAAAAPPPSHRRRPPSPQDTAVEEEESDDDGEGEELCNATFSLAYGGKILLNNARLHLRRGRRYGLCGPNGAGKSTLMKAIAKGQLESFPSPDQLRTVYVEHDVQVRGRAGGSGGGAV
jgi:hypothetical protein